MIERSTLVSSLIVVAGALLACKALGGGGKQGASCSNDGDCRNGLLCESSVCMQAAAAEKIRSLGKAGSGTAPATGGPCQQVVQCCMAMAKASPEAQKACEQYRTMPVASCQMALPSMQQAASAMGVACGGAVAAAPGGTINLGGSGKPVNLGATPGAAAPGGGVAPPTGVKNFAATVDAHGIPLIPAGRSNPPVGNEWTHGVAVNTQATNSQPSACSTRVLREWLQVNCHGKIVGYEKMENFGRKNVDYFESIVPPSIASFVLRMKKGKTQAIRICRTHSRASLFVSWPSSRDRPRHIALGKGPACDGSSWGAFAKKKKASNLPLCETLCTEGMMFPRPSCTLSRAKGDHGGCPSGTLCNIYGHTDGEEMYEDPMCFCDTSKCRMF